MRERINGLDLFSGIGGLGLALSNWVKPVVYCENNRHCQAVLLSRMSAGDLDVGPIWDDVRTLGGRALAHVPIEIIYGGFPCQDISSAGLGHGLEGKRSGLVFEIFRLAKEIKPTFIFLENVSAIRTRGGERVVKELAALGYDCRWDMLSAFDVGAPHKRDRWFLLANARGWGRTARMEIEKQERKSEARGNCRWTTEPIVARVANGVRHRVDRIKGLGNAVVPAQAREAFMRLMGIEQEAV